MAQLSTTRVLTQDKKLVYFLQRTYFSFFGLAAFFLGTSAGLGGGLVLSCLLSLAIGVVAAAGAHTIEKTYRFEVQPFFFAREEL